MLIRSLNCNVCAIDTFYENCTFPVLEFLPAFPYMTAAGSARGSGFRKPPDDCAYNGAPVAFGRKLPVMPVPATGARIMGVNGEPLPTVTWLVTVHSFSSEPRQPSQKFPSPASIPVVY